MSKRVLRNRFEEKVHRVASDYDVALSILRERSSELRGKNPVYARVELKIEEVEAKKREALLEARKLKPCVRRKRKVLCL